MISSTTPVAGVIQLGTLLQLVSTLAAIIGGSVAVITLARAVGHLGRGVAVIKDIHETVKGRQ